MSTTIEKPLDSKQNTISDLATIRYGAAKGAAAVQSSDLAKVATSGSYNDLSDKPSIGTYTKPTTGIPKSDLNSSVQTSLNKADSSAQTYIVNFDILQLLSGEEILDDGGDVLRQAVKDHKLILIPLDKVSPAYGYLPMSVYAEDGIYFSVVYDTKIISGVVWDNDQELRVEDVVIEDVSQKQDKIKFETGGLSFLTASGLNAENADINVVLPSDANGEEDDILLTRDSVKTINGESIFGSGNIAISGGSSSNANVQAVTYNFDDWMNESTKRICRNAVDLTTGEKIYFTGHANYIQCNGGMLKDYIDDGDAQGRSYRWNVEAIEVTDEEVPIEVMNIIFSEQGIVLLNGGVAISDFDNGLIYSHTVKDNIVTITKVYTDFAYYQSVVIDEYDLNGSDSSSGSGSAITSVKIDGVSKSPSSGVVDLGYINKQLSTSTSSSMTLSPNIYYINTSTSLSTLTITLGSVSNPNIINEYFVEFTTRSSGTTVSLPSTIKWMNGTAPTFEAGTTYQISIVNNLGTYIKFK